MENICKTEVFENIPSIISEFPQPQIQLMAGVHAFSNFFDALWTENIWCAFRGETSLSPVKWTCVEGVWDVNFKYKRVKLVLTCVELTSFQPDLSQKK